MKHIRFLSDNATICEKPTRLDMHDDFVVPDFNPDPEPSCKECLELLRVHNLKEFAKEQNEARITMPMDYGVRYYDDGTGMDKFIGGLALATGFWVTVFVIFWAVWLRG